MQAYKLVIFLIIAIWLSGCAHKTPVTDGIENKFCNFQRYHLNLDHRNGPSATSTNIRSLNDVLREGFRPDSKNPIPKDDMLFLSGGSLNGAFGAGVLKGWSEKENGLPDFSVVTGVSTGAILSLAAFTNIPQAAIDGYDVESETQAITPFVRRDKNGKLKKSSYLTALRKGALADIAPLKDTIYRISAEHGVIPAIAKRSYENRLLLTGVVDIDTGEAIALDMTAMARKIYELNPAFKFDKTETIEDLTRRAPEIGRFVNCFTSAIVASSSVPLAARPIAIDNRLYIDGGARFLVFSDVIGPIIDPSVAFKTAEAEASIELYMIINGDQQISAKCGKVNCPDDLNEYDYWDVRGARDDWNVLGLVERTVDVLKTQVGEFSEAEIRLRAFELFLKRKGVSLDDVLAGFGANGFTGLQSFTNTQQTLIVESFENNFENYGLNSLKIEPETLRHIYQGKTCTQWREYDEKTDRNLQFHVNYMRCLIDAGKMTIKNEGWK